MTAGYLLFCWETGPELWLTLIVAAFMIACAAYVVTRPEREVIG